MNANRKWLIHAAFWCVYFSFFLYQITSRSHVDTNWSIALLDATTQVAIVMSIAYLNYFYFLPRFLARRNIFQFLAEFSIPFVLHIILLVFIKRSFVDGYSFRLPFLYSDRFVVQLATIVLFIVAFVALLRFAEDWLELEARKKELENEQLASELRFLKAQINPHFLFNTLNNLYSLAFVQSPNTTDVIAMLSQMMRYMIYDTNQPQVLLSKEIAYMENYISLEKLRLNDEIPITFEITGQISKVQIVPLILITFLENAFKHGVGSYKPQAWIKLTIDVQGNQFHYCVTNSKNPTQNEKSGIGLQNVQRRLMLSYPNRHQLTITELPDQYSVSLKIKLL